MKNRTILAIGLIIFLGISASALSGVVPLAFSASSYSSSEGVAAGVIGTIGTNQSFDFASGDTFSAGNNFGQDLYKRLYSKVKNQGSDLSVARTLARHPLSKEELAIIIPGSSIYQFLDKKQGEQLTSDVPAARRAQLLNDLSEEKELADLETQIEMDIMPSEIFSNGDESDSGFDLISDLDLIETVLFGKTDTALSDAGTGAPAGANVIGLGGNGNGGNANGGGQGAPQPPAAPASGAVPPGTGPKTGSGTKAGAGTANAKNGANGGTDETTSVICPVNSAFNSAVGVAQDNEAAQNAADLKNGNGSGLNANKNSNGGAGGNGDDTGGDTGGVPPPPPPPPSPPDQNSVPAAAPGDWSKPSLCNDVFCLKFEAVYKKASSHQSSENCIACHFEKINDAFKKTVDHNVSPSKQTGNIGEGPKCKRNMLNLKWNLVLIPQPILTPPNDDLVVKGDFVRNFTQFIEKYYNNPGRCTGADSGKAGGACKPDENVSAIPDQEIASAPSEADASEVTQKIQQRLAKEEEKARNLLQQTRLESDAVAQSQQFQVLLQEMDTMNTFFEGYVRLFNAISPGAADAPCQLLLDKAQCS